MSDETIKIVVTAVCAALPATIAAVSSLVNGRKLDDARHKLEVGKISAAPRKRSDKKAGGADGNTASNPDWYEPFDG